jgi:hypothetical protein
VEAIIREIQQTQICAFCRFETGFQGQNVDCAVRRQKVRQNETDFFKKFGGQIGSKFAQSKMAAHPESALKYERVRRDSCPMMP